MMKGQGTDKIGSLERGFVISRFFFIYFAVTGVKKIVRHTKDFVISWFYCTSMQNTFTLKVK